MNKHWAIAGLYFPAWVSVYPWFGSFLNLGAGGPSNADTEMTRQTDQKVCNNIAPKEKRSKMKSDLWTEG